MISLGGESATDRTTAHGTIDDAPAAAVVPAVPDSIAATPACQRCGFPVVSRPWGCRNPCANCGTVYPLGDCSD